MLGPVILQVSRRCLASLFLGFASAALAGDTNTAWISRAWQAEEGLPGNTVVGIAQTPDGFLWVATESGLARFDGVRFEEAAPLRNPNQTFLVDRRGRLWLGKKTANAGGEVVCLDAGTIRVFTTENGVPDWPVVALAEDGEGAVWAASPGSLCRIQDEGCTVFSSEAGLSAGIGKSYVTSDNRGQLWLARFSQVSVYRGGHFRRLLTLKDPCGALGSARSGGVWIGAGTRVLKYGGEGEAQDLGELGTRRPEAKPTVFCEDRRGRLWVGTAGAGLFLYNGAGFEQVALGKHEILCVTEDREGNLWVGSRGGGLARVRPCTFEVETLGSGPSPDGMRSLCQDTSGTLWAVTQMGRLARKEGARWRVLSAEDGWSGPAANCVTPAPEGGVWVGTGSDGLRWWREGEVHALTRKDGLASDSVTALLTTPSGDVWLGTLTPNAVQRLRGGRFQTFMLPQVQGHFESLAVDAAGGVWAATVSGLLARVSQRELVEQTTNTLGERFTINSLCATPDGSLWIGYEGLGVGRLRQGRFSRFGREQGLPDDYIVHILADGVGRLWFAANRGLFSVAETEFEAVAEGRQARVRSVVYGQDEGVPASQAYKRLWPRALRSADGRLWFPMVSGLLVVEPSRLTENREPPPVVIERVTMDGKLVAVYPCGQQSRRLGSAAPLDLRPPRVDGGELRVDRPTRSTQPPSGNQVSILKHQLASCVPRLRLPPGPGQVELEYTALSFVSPRNVVFKHRLAGLERDWVEAGPRRTAYYSHLPPGDYCFEVKACNNDGVWNEAGALLTITVLPHFWQTRWFLVLAVLTALGAAAGTARQVERRRGRRKLEALERQQTVERERRERQQTMEGERARIAADLHDDLGARLTELSLLGSLSLRAAIPLERARSCLGEISVKSNEMVAALDEIVWTVNPKNDSVRSVVNYFCHYAQRFLEPTPIRCRLDVARELPESPLESEQRHHLLLAFKEALNNAARHSAASQVWLRVSARQDALRVVVEDNGRGFAGEPAASEADGLANMRARLARSGGACEVRSAVGRGTTVEFTLPLAGRAGVATGRTIPPF